MFTNTTKSARCRCMKRDQIITYLDAHLIKIQEKIKPNHRQKLENEQERLYGVRHSGGSTIDDSQVVYN